MRIQDIFDIVIMTFLVYQLFIWFRKTRAFQVVIGLGLLALLYMITKSFGLFMTSWILQELGTVIFVLIIVVFQGEIRQALYRFSMLRNFFGKIEDPLNLDIPGLSATIFSLAEQRTGALIVFERQERLEDQLLHGVPLDSLVSSQLLSNIFINNTPLHDGAAIIRNGRITEASCHLPLSGSGDLPQHFGTRHRAALGLTERTDAVVVVVSEERGTVSLAVAGELLPVTSSQELASLLAGYLEITPKESTGLSLKKRLLSNLIPKGVTFLLVFACWLAITAREGAIQTVTAPLKFSNLPENLLLKADSPEAVEVQLKVASTFLATARKLEVTADIDLSGIHEGANTIALDSKAFQLPLGVSVARVTPSTVKVIAERKGRRELPVLLRKTGLLPKGVRIRSVQIEPARVIVEGPESELTQLNHLETEPVELASLRRNQTLERKILQPSPQVLIRYNAPAKVKIMTSSR
jgi:uncharacterized protein (TIGR00159 family)